MREIKLTDIPAHSTFCYSHVVSWHQTASQRKRKTEVVAVLKLLVCFLLHSIQFVAMFISSLLLMPWIYFNLSKRDIKVIKIHLLKVTILHCQICSSNQSLHFLIDIS